MISSALFSPMPWIYCSATRTRLLVGIFTPAIRATYVSPVTDPLSGSDLNFLLFRAGPQTRTRRPAHRSIGARRRPKNYPTWMRGLLMDESGFRQPILGFSSPFRDLFRRPAKSLPAGLLGGRRGPFGDLPGGFGGFFDRSRGSHCRLGRASGRLLGVARGRGGP